MKTDPIRPNFYQGTGGYAWQLAEYLQGNQADRDGGYTITKPMPPRLRNPFAPSPEFFPPSCSVRWAKSVRITCNTPRLVGVRGIRSSLVVVESAQAFGAFRDEDVQALAQETTVGALQGMEINGVVHDAGVLLVALHRHGFIETDHAARPSPSVGYMIEPTCHVTKAPGIARVAINQLNGRTIRLSAASQGIFSLDKRLGAIPQSLQPHILNFVEAGMLRFIAGGNARAHD